jgi:hypothetical protein
MVLRYTRLKKALIFNNIINMDERTTHEDDELSDIKDEQEDTAQDDDSTPADTEEKSEDDPKKADKEAVRKSQREAWLKNLKSGKKTLEDMPGHLGWLKKEPEFDEFRKNKPVKEDDLDLKFRSFLTEREARQDFDLLVEDLQEAEITAEQEAQLKQEYEDIISDYTNPNWEQRRKALLLARRLAGLKDNTSELSARRRKGMSLPPLGNRKRSTVSKDQMTETEKRLSGGLPPGFKA